MKLLLSSLQLASLCALSSYSVSSLTVTQSEDVTVAEGDTATLSCCWDKETERIRVTWLKNNKTVTDEKLLNKVRCWNLTIPNVTQKNSSTYFCHVSVEIPVLIKASGGGTTVRVRSNNRTTETEKGSDGGGGLKSWTLSGAGLGATASVLLITLTCYCCLRRKRDQAARVIYEVPHFDSETQETDKDSTGSRGSSQWCQVLLYESVDYFEHVENKKSG